VAPRLLGCTVALAGGGAFAVAGLLLREGHGAVKRHAATAGFRGDEGVEAGKALGAFASQATTVMQKQSLPCPGALGQCGGQDWKGATCCSPGFVCVRNNALFSQCQADASFGEIKVRNGFCLQAPAPSGPDHKGQVHIWPCSSTSMRQQWWYDKATGLIKSLDGLCLNPLRVATRGSRLNILECDPEASNMTWDYDFASGNIQNRVADKATNLRLCLDAAESEKKGGLVQLWDCWSGKPQRWEIGDAPWAQTEQLLGPAETAALPTACPDRFFVPLEPRVATEHNGVALPDACFNYTGPNRSNHVFVLGDWGGIKGYWKGREGIRPADHRSKKFGSSHRAFVKGVDDCAQLRVAEQMRLRAARSNPDYVLNVGDNFYWGGVGTSDDGSMYTGAGAMCGASPPNVAKPTGQWRDIFESIYWGPGLDGKQWLGVLGNHDYGGWKFTAAWDQAIGYTWAHPPVSSSRWVTPAQFWSAKVWYSNFAVDYYFVDTNFVDAHSMLSDPLHNLCSLEHNGAEASCQDTGPTSVSNCSEWFSRLWSEQLLWLEKELPKSTATWQVVVTHFPPSYAQKSWAPLSAKYGIDLFVVGHVHKQELHPAEGEDSAWILSGGGGGITSEGKPTATGDDNMYGFMDLTLSREEILVELISHGGKFRGSMRVHPRHPAKATVTTTVSSAIEANLTSPTTSMQQSFFRRAVK